MGEDLKLFKKILGIPNVKLIHHNENNNKILKKMTILFSINGSAIWEVAYLKPILCLEKKDGRNFPNVIKINNYNEIFDSTKKLINKDLNSKIIKLN